MPSGSRRTRHRAPGARSPINGPRHAPEPLKASQSRPAESAEPQRMKKRTGTAAERLPEPQRAPHASPRASEDRERGQDPPGTDPNVASQRAEDRPTGSGFKLCQKLRQFTEKVQPPRRLYNHSAFYTKEKTPQIRAYVRKLYTKI